MRASTLITNPRYRIPQIGLTVNVANDSTTTLDASFSGNPNVGSIIVVPVVSNIATWTISDNQGNSSYALLVSTEVSTNQGLYIFVAKVTQSSGTYTVTATKAAGNVGLTLHPMEILYSPYGNYDEIASNNNTTGTTISMSMKTLGARNQLLLGFASHFAGATLSDSLSSGWSSNYLYNADNVSNAGFCLSIQTLVLQDKSNVNSPTWSLTASENWVCASVGLYGGN